MTNTFLKPTTMKLLKLIFFILLISFNGRAQTTNPLRGLYTYQTPFIGDFPLTQSFYLTTSIDEIDDHYFLSGGGAISVCRYAGLISIDKNNHSVLWKYMDTSHLHVQLTNTMSKDLVKRSDVLMISYNEEQDQSNDDSLNVALFDYNSGIIQKNKFAIDTLQRFKHFTELDYNLSALSGRKTFFNPNISFPLIGWGYTKPYVLLLQNDATIVDSIVLPLGNVYANLPILQGQLQYTFPFKNAYLSIGEQIRADGLHPGNNYFDGSPTIWYWNQDSVISFQEIYKDFSPHSSSIACDYVCSSDLKKDKLAFLTVRSQTCNNGEDVAKVFVNIIDSLFNVQWCEKIGTLPHNQYLYDRNPQVVIDTFTNTIISYGQVLNQNNASESLFFLEKRNMAGNRIFCKHFFVNGDPHQYLTSMTIANNGDLLFAGAGMASSDTSYFFTYRTNPDGYDPAGQYLGLEVITASPTEIGIFPNPSDGVFQVSSLSEEQMLITLLDQQGKQVALFELNELSSNNSFDLSDQVPGVYFAHISQGENQWVKKLVVR
jgi:hypothetical protein